MTNVVRGGLYPETDAYSYDLAGNRTFSTDKVLANQTWTANALNQYTSSTWNGFSHDADGNLKTVGGIATFFWDAENRFVALSNASSVTRYAYDWRHRRVRSEQHGRSAPQERRGFVYDGWNLLHEHQERWRNGGWIPRPPSPTRARPLRSR